MPTTLCGEVYVIQLGCMAYLRAGRDEDHIAAKGEAFCLPSLWTEWYHHGRLTARKGACYYVGIDCTQFGKLAISVGGPLYRHLQIFGILLIGSVESAVEEGRRVDDLCLEPDQLKELVSRAQRFASLVGAGGGFESLESLRPSQASSGPDGRRASGVDLPGHSKVRELQEMADESPDVFRV